MPESPEKPLSPRAQKIILWAVVIVAILSPFYLWYMHTHYENHTYFATFAVAFFYLQLLTAVILRFLTKKKLSQNAARRSLTTTEPVTENTNLPKSKMVMYHDDPPCNSRLNDKGVCPNCNFVPDMQSVVLIHCCPTCDQNLSHMKCPTCGKEFEPSLQG